MSLISHSWQRYIFLLIHKKTRCMSVLILSTGTMSSLLLEITLFFLFFLLFTYTHHCWCINGKSKFIFIVYKKKLHSLLPMDNNYIFWEPETYYSIHKLVPEKQYLYMILLFHITCFLFKEFKKKIDRGDEIIKYLMTRLNFCYQEEISSSKLNKFSPIKVDGTIRNLVNDKLVLTLYESTHFHVFGH